MKIDAMLSRGIVCFDGGFGSQVAAMGLPADCPESLNLTNPDAVREIHRAYVEAGARVIETNTLGATPIRLKAHGLANDAARVTEAAVSLAREAGAPLIACSMGTTAEFLSPVGALAFERAIDNFAVQAKAAKAAGADFILTETLTDVGEARAMWIAAKEAGMPFAATFTFLENGRTLTGSPPEVCALVAQAMGAFMVGVNCVGDLALAGEMVRRMRAVCSMPILCQPNAGLPEKCECGALRYPVSPEEFLVGMEKIVRDGAAAVGGCCGTTPAHIRLLRQRFETAPAPEKGGDNIARIASSRAALPIDQALADIEEMDAAEPDTSDAACVLLDFADAAPEEAVPLLEEALTLLTQPLIFRARREETLAALRRRYPGTDG